MMARRPRVQLVVDGKDNTKRAFGAVSKSLGALEKKTVSVGRAMAASLTGIISVRTLKRIADVNTEMSKLDRVLRENTESQEAFNYAQQETSRIADELGVSIGKVINDFGGLNGSMAALGYGSKEAVRVTETLTKLMSLEGADPAPTIRRFTRALSKGELHQARFNLMLQEQPALLDLVAAATGKTIKELRELSKTGELTALMLTDSVLEMGDVIDERFSEVPQTVEQAMNRINNNISNAFRDDELMQPMVDSLNELADVLKDPAVNEGLAILAAGLATAAKAVAEGASDFAWFAKDLGYLAAASSGSVAELDRLDREIRLVDKSLNASWFGTKRSKHIFMSESELQLERRALETRKRQIINAMTGTTEEMRAEEEKRQAMLADEKAKEAALHRKYVEDIKEYNRQAVKAVEDRGKELAKAEKEAAKKVADAKKEIAAIEKQFDDIRDGMKAGADKELTYVDYQRLSTAARQALAAGDTAKAKDDALAAANVLKELAAAGENTYGFEGMVNSMEALATSAAEIEQSAAEAKLESIQTEMLEMAKQAEELKEIPIGFEMDDAELATVKTQIAELLEQLKVDAVIPVRLAAGDAPSGKPPEGFARGGHIRGPGTSTSDSILARLSDGEYVVRAAAVRKYGLDTLNSINNMRLPKFASGGLIEAATHAAPPSPQPLGTLNFHLPQGEQFSVQAAGSNWDELHRAALKYGRTTRR